MSKTAKPTYQKRADALQALGKPFALHAELVRRADRVGADLGLPIAGQESQWFEQIMHELRQAERMKGIA